MIMEAMLILTLSTPGSGYAQNPARMTTHSQMLPTMEACHRTQRRLEALHDRRTGSIREYMVTVTCVSTQ